METTIKLKRELFRFDSEQHWINTAKSKFSNCGVYVWGYICLDSAGNVCTNGGHFRRAKEEKNYPVIVYEIN